jgi:hypothetical protein
MDEKLKAKWVKALRSGKYKQAHDTLKGETNDRDIGYCCLGVLCEIAPGIKWSDIENHYVITQRKLASVFPENKEEFVDNGGDWERTKQGVLIAGESLPEPLYKHFGMNKRVVDNGARVNVHTKLINMNDRGEDFNKIADYIEKVL